MDEDMAALWDVDDGDLCSSTKSAKGSCITAEETGLMFCKESDNGTWVVSESVSAPAVMVCVRNHHSRTTTPNIIDEVYAGAWWEREGLVLSAAPPICGFRLTRNQNWQHSTAMYAIPSR